MTENKSKDNTSGNLVEVGRVFDVNDGQLGDISGFTVIGEARHLAAGSYIRSVHELSFVWQDEFGALPKVGDVKNIQEQGTDYQVFKDFRVTAVETKEGQTIVTLIPHHE